MEQKFDSPPSPQFLVSDVKSSSISQQKQEDGFQAFSPTPPSSPAPMKRSGLSMGIVVILFFCMFLLSIGIMGISFYHYAGKVPHVILTATDLPQGPPEGNTTSAQETRYKNDISDANTFWSQKQYQQVGDKAKDALVYASNDDEKAVAHYWSGLSFYMSGDLNTAEREENTAISLQPNFPAAYSAVSAINLVRGNYDNALSFADKSISFDPNYAWGYNDRGLALLKLGRHDEGITSLKKAVELAPDNATIKDNLTRAENGQF